MHMKPFTARPSQWLLLSDIHFNHNDLDRVQRTASWIVSLARERRIRRVVICGDLLTARPTQSTRVLSACYRFIDELALTVPRINIVLGNHDLAYKNDYSTTALDALNLSRLRPYVSIHSSVSTDIWEGRPVLFLPFRKDQTELTNAIAALDANEARNTVAFAHASINKGITQRHVVGFEQPITYRGLTGPIHFSPLARTYSGHFHSYQTILQSRVKETGHVCDPLQGSITYLGSPLQLSWHDLRDEQRGVVLLNPETLQHEQIVSPHAVGFATADLEQVLQGEVDVDILRGKHVMLQGVLSLPKYATAHDILMSCGVRSVRKWGPLAPVFRNQGLGVTVPSCALGVQDTTALQEVHQSSDPPNPQFDNADPGLERQPKQLDLGMEARAYVESVELDDSLAMRQDQLIRIGQRLIQVSSEVAADTEKSSTINYDEFLGSSLRDGGGMKSPAAAIETVFVAKPRRLTITNFLSIQGTLRLEFGRDLKCGLTLLVGVNGSGKSTLVEAMTWCQFGRCIRHDKAMSVARKDIANDVVNNVVRKNCSVSLEFENGYTITRYRKDKTHANRIIVSLHGKEQTHFEHANARDTQKAINKLLGIDYDTFVKTVVLGHESGSSFLSSTPTERREHIEAVLGLAELEPCGRVCRRILKSIDESTTQAQGNMNKLTGTMEFIRPHLKELQADLTRLAQGLEHTTACLKTSAQDLGAVEASVRDLEKPENQPEDIEDITRDQDCPDISLLDLQLRAVTETVNSLLSRANRAKLNSLFSTAKHALDSDILEEEQRLRQLKALLSRVQIQIQSMQNTVEMEPEPSIVGNAQHRLLNGPNLSAPQAFRTFTRYLKNLFTRPYLWVFQSLFRRSQKLEIVLPGHTKEPPQNSDPAEQTNLMILTGRLEQDIMATECRITELQRQAGTDVLIRRIALCHDIDIQDLRAAVADKGACRDVSVELAEAVQAQATLQLRRENLLAGARQQEALRRQEALRGQEAFREREALWQQRATERREKLRAAVQQRDRLQLQIDMQKREIATHRRLIEADEASLAQLSTKQRERDMELKRLSDDRELYAFWAKALAKKTGQANPECDSESRSKKKKAPAPEIANFREHLLKKRLGELNTFTAQILAVLCQDTRHARELDSVTGMLRSLFSISDEDEDGSDGRGSETAVLDKSLNISAGLAYRKCSSGERKRVDLALFFGLLCMSHARSTHRAHHLLVDEVFDSLDATNLAMVLRLCRFMAARVPYIVVITHSQDLVTGGIGGAGEDDGSSKHTVVVAKGKQGTELLVEGRQVGRDGSGA